jgi:hypothetical protein
MILRTVIPRPHQNERSRAILMTVIPRQNESPRVILTAVIPRPRQNDCLRAVPTTVIPFSHPILTTVIPRQNESPRMILTTVVPRPRQNGSPRMILTTVIPRQNESPRVIPTTVHPRHIGPREVFQLPPTLWTTTVAYARIVSGNSLPIGLRNTRRFVRELPQRRRKCSMLKNKDCRALKRHRMREMGHENRRRKNQISERNMKSSLRL